MKQSRMVSWLGKIKNAILHLEILGQEMFVERKPAIVFKENIEPSWKKNSNGKRFLR